MYKNAFISETIFPAVLLLLVLGAITNCGSKIVGSIEPGKNINERAANNSPSPDKTPRRNSNDFETAPTDLSKIPTVTYCDLIKNAAAYDNKIVRLRAIHFSGFEQIYIYDDRCEIGQPPTAPKKVPAETWAQWDKTFVSKGDTDEAKLNRRLNGFGRKDVNVVGRFDSTNKENYSNAPSFFGHMNCCRFQFSIMRVESVVILEGETAAAENNYGKPVKFAPDQKIEFADFTLVFQKDFQLYVAVPQPGQKLPTYAFKIEKGKEVSMVFPNSDEADISPLKFEIGGKRYHLESGIADQSGKLAKNELIVWKLN